MANTATLAIRIISDATKAAKELGALEGKTRGMAGAMERAQGPAKAVVAGIAAIGVASFKQASDLQQASGAVESVYGRQADKVKALASAAGQQVGLATSEYSNLAAVLGAQLGNLGVSQDKLVGTTDQLITVGADLSAMFGGTTAEAVEALSAAFRGETDPMEKYGVSLKQATVDAYLAAHGQSKLKGAALQQAQTQARLAIIMEQTSKAQGQFAREADSAAGAQQRAEAAAKNAGASLGAVLLPVVAAAATALAGMAGWMQDNQTTSLAIVGTIGALATGILAANAAMRVWKATATAIRVATIVWRNAQLLLNLAMMANPIGLVIAIVVALVAIIVLAYRKVGWFRAGVQAMGRAAVAAFRWVLDMVGRVWGWVKKNWPLLLGILTGPIGLAVVFIVRHWDKIKAGAAKVKDFIVDKLVAGFRWLKDKAIGALDAIVAPIRKLIGWVQDLLDKIGSIHLPSAGGVFDSLTGGIFSFASTGGGASPTLMGATALAGGGATGTSSTRSAMGGVTVHIHGAIDPVGTARQIRQILGADARRFGRA